MRIRPYLPQDGPRLVEIYEGMGMTYAFPQLEIRGPGGEMRPNPLFCSKLVLEDDAGRVQQAVLARMTTEIYLLMDPAGGTPEERWQRFKEIHAASEADVYRGGFTDAHAFLPPEMARRFGKRLVKKLGWVKETWPTYCKYLGGK